MFKRTSALLGMILLSMALVMPAAAGLPFGAKQKSLTKQELRDKIAGGWAGKIIGVTYGACTEFVYCQQLCERPLEWDPAWVQASAGQDDLYTQLCFMMALDKWGLGATTEQFGQQLAQFPPNFCHANRRAWVNLNQGIPAALCGSPEYNLHCDDIDFQIEADFIGLINPGMPASALDLADRVGRLMAYGDGLYGGMFVSALCAEAFFEDDPVVIVKRAYRSLPAKSLYAQAVKDVLEGYERYPQDWRKTWRLIEEKWAVADLCVPFHPFNIDAKINGAYIAMGLLYGQGDFAKTMEISMRCGQDSDCNPSSAAGVLGIITGFSGIPEQWTSGFEGIDDMVFFGTDYTFPKAVDRSLAFACEEIVKQGGRVEGDRVWVKLQKPAPPKLEVSFDPSVFAKTRVLYTDKTGWGWKGNWTEQTGTTGGPLMQGEGAGTEVSFSFDGTGVLIMGDCGPEGGLAQAYVDGSLHRQIDSWYVRGYGNDWVNGCHLYHVMDLEPGPHTVRLVLTGEKNEKSTGGKMWIVGAIVYDRK